jgi:predicted DNA-binding antitoxin AbrB/MazE fold protein
MKAIHAVYAKGVSHPKEPVDLAEQCEMEFEPRLVDPGQAALAQVYAVLSERSASGQHDVAEGHNEHQA